MNYAYKGKALNGLFRLDNAFTHWTDRAQEEKDLIHILWNNSDLPADLLVDGMLITLNPQQMTTLTYLHKVVPGPRANPVVSYSFNREFYCIYDHDEEVSCNGIIFFGSQELPIIALDEEEQRKFSLLHAVFIDEFQTPDKIQGEMLRMLLKRLIIKCTRLAKDQLTTKKLDNDHIELIRKFNYLVDMNFKEKKTVKEYADLLYKSPKTLSNMFSLYDQKTPLQIIHERIVLEARRLLVYSDKPVKEITYDLGFTEVATFYKIFKKYMQLSPQQFRDSLKI